MVTFLSDISSNGHQFLQIAFAIIKSIVPPKHPVLVLKPFIGKRTSVDSSDRRHL